MNDSSSCLPKINWAPILYHLKHGQLVPFLGAGASLGFNGSPGLPTSGELSEILADECSYPGCDRRDLLRVSQYFALTISELHLRKTIHEKLSVPDVKPGRMHQILAGLPIKTVLTTNYDNLMERAFCPDKDPVKVIYKRGGDAQEIKIDPTVECPLVYKLHGSLEDIDSMVITENDYIDFLIRLINGDPKVPNFIKNVFQFCSILFIGYGLRDWNIRVLLKYLRKESVPCFAVQRDPLADTEPVAANEWENSIIYWQNEKIAIYNCDALTFVTELDRKWKEAGHV
ncbi:SIR2 family protein [candidate division KSB1 bacterium]|nr:SIR2 family protein [candidate division KSB1 bacterium]